jgi:hypothetical protein
MLIGPPGRGAMAQSVARLVRNEKVRGSSPLSSTTTNLALTRPFVLLAGERDCFRIYHVCRVVAVVGLLDAGRRL